MELSQNLIQTQKLILTQAVRQSLTCLTLPVQELDAYLRDAALSNPVLEVETAPLDSPPPEPPRRRTELRDREEWRGSSGPSEGQEGFERAPSRSQSFPEYLDEQLRQMKELDKRTRALCQYLAGCLNSAGYMDCPLSELAGETGASLFDLEQALYVLQSLDPPGTAARSLEECLVLQLAQTPHFNALNLKMIRAGLPLLSRGDYAGLSKLLSARPDEVRASAEVIRGLNPIPSQGFDPGGWTAYIIPEAAFRVEDGRVLIELNRPALPRVSLNREYCAMLGREEYADIQPYLRENAARARELKEAVEKREQTLESLLSTVAEIQQDYFLGRQPLKPMTMRQVSERMGVNVSTVSRAVKDKYIECRERLIPLRELFSTPVGTADAEQVSGAAARQQLRAFVAAEDPHKPLSDEALSGALAAVGIPISRRTVAKYRQELGIPSSGKRRRP